ncbi:MAG: hypothetical protein M1485_00660 [Chloroflexi bacterium]|nr:hypothetical protein [Chloroflexota bacterium]
MSTKHPKENLRINLCPSSAWTSEDLNELINSLEEFGPVTGERISLPRGSGLQTTLEFLAAAIFTGFLEKIGGEIYESLRIRLKELLKAKPNQKRRSKFADFLIIFGPGPSSGNIVEYTCEFYREDDLNIFLMTVGNLHSLLTDPNINGLDRLPKGIIDNINVFLCTKDGLQRFAQMRINWLLQSRKKPVDFPSPPYWVLDTSVKNNRRWYRYVAIVPARVSPKAFSFGKPINWKRYK